VPRLGGAYSALGLGARILGVFPKENAVVVIILSGDDKAGDELKAALLSIQLAFNVIDKAERHVAAGCFSIGFNASLEAIF